MSNRFPYKQIEFQRAHWQYISGFLEGEKSPK